MPWITRQLQKLSREQQEKLMPALAATNWITEVSLLATRPHILVLCFSQIG